ncbi:hypothetical protein GBAR_LOCUS11660 [Geodia barretti]|uniref:Uncharacterized protein n=1 Tax=Geodia barretti TaxID=519541 RepID=A0AA35RY73_GEOBA|nr:hypothetical protein GBAR_LOCUS11660 [Geodia barretti]
MWNVCRWRWRQNSWTRPHVIVAFRFSFKTLHTHPTNMGTTVTCHMQATSILLNWGMTLWTFFPIIWVFSIHSNSSSSLFLLAL